MLRPKFAFPDMMRFLAHWVVILAFTCFFSLIPGALLAGAILPEYDPESPAPPLQVPLTFLVALTITGLLVWLLLTIRRRAYTGSAVLVSPVGLEMRDHLGAALRLRWQEVTAIERLRKLGLSTMGGILDERSGPMTPNYGAAGQQAHPADGIVGRGTVALPAPVPRQWRTVLHRATPADPARRLYTVGLRFGAFGPVTAANPLVAQTLRYRPDLFQAPPAPR